MYYHLPQKDIILASASSARQKMLRDAGLKIETQPAHVDEDSLKQAAQAENLSGLDAATLIAEMKAQKISGLHPDAFVIGSDQLLTQDHDWFSKPIIGRSENNASTSFGGNPSIGDGGGGLPEWQTSLASCRKPKNYNPALI